MDWRLRVPSTVYRLLVERFGSDKALADYVRGHLEQLANGNTAQQLGGKARARMMSKEERSESARHAALARHRGDDDEDENN